MNSRLLVICLLLFTKPLCANQPIQLKWGFVRLPPLAYLDEQNNAVGTFSDIIYRIGQQANLEFEAFEFPNARALFSINKKKTNFAIGVRSMVADSDKFVFSKYAFAKMQLMVLWRKGTTPVFDYQQLDRKNLILIQAYTYNGFREELEQKARNIVNVENHQRAIDALLLQRADYALVYKLAAEFAIEQETTKNSEQLSGIVIDEYDLYFILDADFPNAKDIMRKIETAYEASL